jgi:hypothetical protein
MPLELHGSLTEDVETFKDQDIPLNSSFISSCYYDAQNQTLYLRMQGGEYTLVGVPPDEFIGLISASSPGQYFNSVLKGKY